MAYNWNCKKCDHTNQFRMKFIHGKDGREWNGTDICTKCEHPAAEKLLTYKYIENIKLQLKNIDNPLKNESLVYGFCRNIEYITDGIVSIILLYFCYETYETYKIGDQCECWDTILNKYKRVTITEVNDDYIGVHFIGYKKKWDEKIFWKKEVQNRLRKIT